jgi:glycosyltransferase involved in cell wall biosynthesis
MCVKNASNTIRDAINCVLTQDFPHEFVELIVVDGYSADGTLKILKEILLKSDIRSIIFKENEGLGFARQIVVDTAVGDYIIWVDGDMIFPKNYVRKQVEFMERNPKVGIASGYHGILPEANLIAFLEDIAYIAVDYKFGGSLSSRFPGTAGSIFRTEAIRQVDGFNPSIRGVGEDIEAAYRVRQAGWCIHIGTEAKYYEKRKETWKKLWDHYYWYGYGAYDVLFKMDRISNLLGLSPLAGFFVGVWYSIVAYKLINQKKVFLLPFHYAFKRLALYCGLIRSYMSW